MAGGLLAGVVSGTKKRESWFEALNGGWPDPNGDALLRGNNVQKFSGNSDVILGDGWLDDSVNGYCVRQF